MSLSRYERGSKSKSFAVVRGNKDEYITDTLEGLLRNISSTWTVIQTLFFSSVYTSTSPSIRLTRHGFASFCGNLSLLLRNVLARIVPSLAKWWLSRPLHDVGEACSSPSSWHDWPHATYGAAAAINGLRNLTAAHGRDLQRSILAYLAATTEWLCTLLAPNKATRFFDRPNSTS